MNNSPYIHITAAFQEAAKQRRGGITELALSMDKSPNVLANKLNPNCESHYLSIEEAAEIIVKTSNQAPVAEMARPR